MTAFDSLAPRVMNDLRVDFGLTAEQAAGVLGNLGAESGLISGRQEGTTASSKPYPIRGHTGGIDWPQWTGSRRKDFAEWVERTGTPYPSYAASYGFLKYELQNSYKHAIQQLKKTTTVKAAVETFEAHYEKAGIKNWTSRLDYAARAMKLWAASEYAKGVSPVPVPTPAPIPPSTDMRPINNEQLAAFIRQILLVGSGYMIARGVGTAETWAMITPAIIAFGTAAWGFWARTDKNLIKSAADVPVVTQIAVNPTPAVVAPAQVVTDIPAPNPVHEAWAPPPQVEMPRLDEMPLNKLAQELPAVLEVIGLLVPAVGVLGKVLKTVDHLQLPNQDRR